MILRGYEDVSFLCEKMFAKLMLPENVAKGDHWKEIPLETLLILLTTEVEELCEEITHNDKEGAYERIIGEAADVANFCMMIVARARASIPPPPAPVVQKRKPRVKKEKAVESSHSV